MAKCACLAHFIVAGWGLGGGAGSTWVFRPIWSFVAYSRPISYRPIQYRKSNKICLKPLWLDPSLTATSGYQLIRSNIGIFQCVLFTRKVKKHRSLYQNNTFQQKHYNLIPNMSFTEAILIRPLLRK